MRLATSFIKILFILIIIPTILQAQFKFQSVMDGPNNDNDVGLKVFESETKYIVAGNVYTNAIQDEDIIFVIFDKSSNYQSHIIIEGTGATVPLDRIWDCIVSDDDHFVIAGEVRSINAPQNNNIVIGKIDTNGLPAWIAQIGEDGNIAGPQPIDETGYSIIQTMDGGYVIGGSFTDMVAGEQDGMLIKLDASGNFIWGRRLNIDNSAAVHSVIEDETGNIVLTGYGNDDNSIGGQDIIVYRFSASGNFDKGVLAGTAENDIGREIVPYRDGGYIITGTTQSGGGDLEVYVLKTDDNLIPEWSGTYGDGNNEAGTSILLMEDGGALIAGYTEDAVSATGPSDALLVRIDDKGNFINARKYGGGGSEEFNDIARAWDAGIVIDRKSVV